MLRKPEHLTATAQRRMDLRYPDLGAACADVAQLRQGGYELVGTWSLAQILDHLNMSMQMTTDGAPFTFPALMRPVMKLMFMPTMRKGKPSKLRGKAPQQLQPALALDEDVCVNRFYKLAESLMDPSTPFVSHYPMLGRLNREQWLLLQQWHAAHHLSFVVPIAST
ncbi:DUF1569 domain-containing protein [Allorhodopirellula heiligendammensis]|uniref:DinB superfamily protein n=1 Tax=Allorhodopirellula heiligendammensis TaxID=2714739 RepID=A0A5C6BT75_9BACT|nr:DUF1569 domain-containing protein [Allorhodopirellula heiligendammensis]TWU15195.1 hypothetical protein Poly21_23880 [Allorhodopirellula heiligendammensis]